MRKIISSSVIGAVSSAFVASSSANIVFQDSFGGDLANTSPTYTDAVLGNYPALQGTDIGKQWMVRTPTGVPVESRQWAVQVRNDDPVSSGNQYLSLHRNTVSLPLAAGGTFGYAHAQLSDADRDANVGRTVTVGLSLYIAAADRGNTPIVSGTTGELFRLIGHPLNTIGNPAGNGDLSAASFTGGTFSSRFYATGSTGFQTQGLVNTGDTTPVPIFKFDEWNQVTVTTYLGAAVPYFTMSVANSAGTMTSAQQKLFTASATTIGTVELTVFNDSIAKIDNLQISNDAVSTLPGDFDHDGDRDATDIDLLFAAQQGAVPPALALYDLNADNVVNSAPNTTGSDVDVWVRTLKLTEYGDVDLNGHIDFSDLLALAQNYGGTTGGWSAGSFDGAPGVQFNDLLMLAQHYGFGGLQQGDSEQFAADWALAQSLVPEPAAISVLAAGVASRRRR